MFAPEVSVSLSPTLDGSPGELSLQDLGALTEALNPPGEIGDVFHEAVMSELKAEGQQELPW